MDNTKSHNYHLDLNQIFIVVCAPGAKSAMYKCFVLRMHVFIISIWLRLWYQPLKLSLGTPGDRRSQASPRRTAPQKRKRSVGDNCLIWLFWCLVIVHLWTYKFFFLILPVPIVCILIKKFGLFMLMYDIMLCLI